MTLLAKLDGETLMTIISISNHLKRIADALEKNTQPHEALIDGADPEIQRLLGIKPEAKQRKRYRGTYTDEQSISSKLGRSIKRSELKEAAAAVGVEYIQDETNHHVYIKNTVLDVVLKYLKASKK